jgi:N-acetylmuramoyl-L-alanine amidase
LTQVLRRGDGGEPVRDLQQRLSRLGLSIDDELGDFGTRTEQAVRSFQEQRGLRVDGLCGPQTWGALVESGFHLGDRLLYNRQPMLRGDDIADLQQRLNALGFDAGREDGIFGKQTADALREFQRNAGVAVDGIAGPATSAALNRLGARGTGSVAAVRERESLRFGRPLAGSRIYVSTTPGLEVLGTVVERGLLEYGATVVLDAAALDDSEVAANANRFEADVFLAIRPGESDACRCTFFATPTFRSESGYQLARAIQQELADVVAPAADEPCAKTYPLLRETRMAAVVCEPVQHDDLDAMRELVRSVSAIGYAVVRGVRRGLEEPKPAGA